MKAVVYKEPFKVSVEEVSRPTVQHVNDAIVRISTTAI
jgi:glutathione-independent formaldehyde dehydrogenase